ncbi:MAG: hypothetical protein IT258_03275 [Saprospiraceae bacterium]|nr:hypothetical protein [Saprospiraceae bacterium]
MFLLTVEAPATCSNTGNDMPDLTIQNINLAGSSVTAGGSWIGGGVFFQVVNIGQAAYNGTYKMRAYLSVDELLDGNDYLIETSSSLYPPINVSAPIPVNIPQGFYHVILNVDYPNEVAESNESNNVVASTELLSVARTDGLPDLYPNYVSNIIYPQLNIYTVGDTLSSQIGIVNLGGPIPPNQFPIKLEVFISSDEFLDASDYLISQRFLVNEVFYGFNIKDPIPLNVPEGVYYMIARLDNGMVVTELNEGNNVNSSKGNSGHETIQVLHPVGSGQIDLSLLAQQLTANPAQWSNYPVKLTLSNAGPQAATGVKVKFAKPAGVVYVGGNEFTASQGSFNPNGDQVWTVGSIPANGSATLTVNYFLLNASVPVAYAQVTAANETDSDSQPNNGTPPTPVQDDEAATSGGSGPTPQPDLTIADLQIPNVSVVAGAILSYNFNASNAGTAAVPGNFTIKSYISTDQTLSANDVQDGTIQTGNYTAGFAVQNVPGASTIPANLAAGQYYLIVKIDGDNAIAESNENNNMVVKPFTIMGGTTICQGDLILESQAEVDAVNCYIVEGDLRIRSPFGSQGASSDITDLSPLLGITQVNGAIVIENNDQLFNLHGLENITSAHHVAVVFCENLQHVQGLSGLSGAFQLGVVMLSNPSLLNVDGLEGITQLGNSLTLTHNTSLQNLNGLSGLTSVNGLEIHLGGNTSLTSIEGLSNLTNVNGVFVIENCDALQSLNGLQSLQAVGTLALDGNDVLADISALSALASVQTNIYLKNHPLLSDCCVLFDLLDNNGGSFTTDIGNNAGNCNSEQDILDNCTGSSDPCSSITITPAPNKITIAGFSAPHVLIKVFRPNWTVAFECLDGACTNPVVVSGLTTGSHYVEVKLLDAGWAEICKKTQTVGVSNIVAQQDDRMRLSFDKFYPNPTAYQTTMELYSPVEQAATLDFYDRTGRLVHTMKADLTEGVNTIEVMVFDWKSGTYNVVARGEKTRLPAYGRFLKVWEE